MIYHRRNHLFFLIIILSLMMAACQHKIATPADENMQTATESETRERTPNTTLSATLASTKTPVPEPTASGTPTASPTGSWFEKALELTPFPFIDTQISLQNSESVRELAVWGTGEVNDILLSPDGVLLAVGTNLGVYLYDSLTFKLLLFMPTRCAVQAIAFSTENTWIALGENGGLIEVFDYVEDIPITSLNLNRANLRESDEMTLAFSDEDIHLIAVIKTEGQIHINRWEISTWHPTASFSLNKGLADFINIEVDLLGIFSQETLTFQSLSHSDESHTIPLTNAVSEVLWGQIGTYEPQIIPSPQGDFFIENSGSAVILWRILKDKVSYRLDDYPTSLPDPCYNAPDTCLNANGSFSWDCSDSPNLPPIELIAMTPDNVMVLISLNQGGTEFRRVSDNILAWKSDEQFKAVTFSPGGEFFFGLKANGIIEKRSTLDGELLDSLTRHPSELYDLAFSPNGTVLAAGFNDGFVRMYSLLDGQMLGVLTGSARSLTFSPDGALLAGGLDDGQVRIYELDLRRYYDLSPGHLAAVTDLVFSFDGNELLSVSDDCTTSLWDLTGRYRKWHDSPVEEDPFRIWDVVMPSNSAFRFISGNREGLFRLENTDIWECVLPLQNGFNDLALSSDGSYLGAAGTQSWLLTDLESGGDMKLHQLVSDPASEGVSLSFTLDGSTLILAGEQELQFWSTSEATLCSSMRFYAETPPDGRPVALEISPDGMLIALGTKDGLIHIFGLPLTSLD